MQKEAITELLNWYETEHRLLPWREKKDAYAIWVSEIMLQQTRVEAVKPYYTRFMEALPTPADLAACPEDKLLKLWEGLGYYSRVRNMQKCAKVLMDKYNGKLPADYDLLLKLPGIGSYTAGAIGSIAYKLPVPAVDGNVLRVWARIHADSSDVLSQKTKKRVENEFLEDIPKDSPDTFNQAMMELGAMVCLPNGEPHCGECPVYDWCKSGKTGNWSRYPVKKKAKARKIEDRTILIIQDGLHTCLEKRPETGLLAGMYQFPNLEGHLSKEEVLDKIAGMGFEALHIEKLQEAKHIFSHVEWHMIGYAVRIADRTSSGKDNTENTYSPFIFAETGTVSEQYSVPAALKSYARYIRLKIGQEKFEDDQSG